jgi:hypothetical protein
MARMGYEELGRITGEVLPERAVLSMMASPGHGGATIAYACQGTTGGSSADPGTLAAVMQATVAAAPRGDSLQCFPAVVLNH